MFNSNYLGKDKWSQSFAALVATSLSFSTRNCSICHFYRLTEEPSCFRRCGMEKSMELAMCPIRSVLSILMKLRNICCLFDCEIFIVISQQSYYLSDGTEIKLGRWVDKQRQVYRKGSLREDRVNLLETLVQVGMLVVLSTFQVFLFLYIYLFFPIYFILSMKV